MLIFFCYFKGFLAKKMERCNTGIIIQEEFFVGWMAASKYFHGQAYQITESIGISVIHLPKISRVLIFIFLFTRVFYNISKISSVYWYGLFRKICLSGLQVKFPETPSKNFYFGKNH